MVECALLGIPAILFYSMRLLFEKICTNEKYEQNMYGAEMCEACD